MSEPESFPDIYPNSIADEAYQDFSPLIEKYGDPDDTLKTFLRALGFLLKQVDDIARDGPDGEPGWSQIFDLNRAKTEWLPWTGQLVGYHVPTKPDTQTWAEYDAEQRSLIVSMSAHKRGTVAMLRATVQKQLTGGKRVYITERYGGDPWLIKLWVNNMDIATSIEEVYAAAYSQKVAGLLMEVSILVDETYDRLRAIQTDYQMVKDKFANYRELGLDPGKP